MNQLQGPNNYIEILTMRRFVSPAYVVSGAAKNIILSLLSIEWNSTLNNAVIKRKQNKNVLNVNIRYKFVLFLVIAVKY